MKAAETSVFVTAPDGLKLHVRCYGPRPGRGLPIMCLPGLSRTCEDFADLAAALSGDANAPRRVLAMDYRGRGLSDYDKPAHYSFPVELADAIAVMTALSAAPAVLIGTSRGGLLAMLLGALRPSLIAGVVLNDIGPVIDPRGLIRIRASLGKMPEPKNFADGADLLQRMHGAQFPTLTPAQWLAFARRSWRERNGRLVPTYDPKLAVTLAGFDLESPLPPIWKEFDALAGVPMMVIHGANSDILSRETIAAMRARRATLDVIEIPDQGHTPLLAESDIMARIADFIGRCEDRAPR